MSIVKVGQKFMAWTGLTKYPKPKSTSPSMTDRQFATVLDPESKTAGGGKVVATSFREAEVEVVAQSTAPVSTTSTTDPILVRKPDSFCVSSA